MIKSCAKYGTRFLYKGPLARPGESFLFMIRKELRNFWLAEFVWGRIRQVICGYVVKLTKCDKVMEG